MSHLWIERDEEIVSFFTSDNRLLHRIEQRLLFFAKTARQRIPYQAERKFTINNELGRIMARFSHKMNPTKEQSNTCS